MSFPLPSSPQDLQALKDAAQRLRTFLAGKGHQYHLEALCRSLYNRSWSEVSALAKRKQPACQRCDSPLEHGYCSDETCPYTHWPQTVCNDALQAAINQELSPFDMQVALKHIKRDTPVYPYGGHETAPSFNLPPSPRVCYVVTNVPLGLSRDALNEALTDLSVPEGHVLTNIVSSIMRLHSDRADYLVSADAAAWASV